MTKKQLMLKDMKIVCKHCNSVLITVEQILNKMKNTIISDVEHIDTRLEAYSNIHIQCPKCGEYWGEVTLNMDEDLKKYAKLWIEKEDLNDV